MQGRLIRCRSVLLYDYDLLIKDSNTRIDLRLTQGDPDESFVLSKHRYLEFRNARPLQITEIENDANENEIRIKLDNTTDYTRVHVIATRFSPIFRLFEGIGSPLHPPLSEVKLRANISHYLSGRNIGDEYRYILERKYARKFAGNMLKRPSLLLAPWSLRKTDTGTEEAEEGEVWADVDETSDIQRSASRYKEGSVLRSPTRISDFSNLDFLPDTIVANALETSNGLAVPPYSLNS